LLSPLHTTNTGANNCPITPGLVAKTEKVEYFLGKDKTKIYQLTQPNWTHTPYEMKWWNASKNLTYRKATKKELEYGISPHAKEQNIL